MDRGAWQATVRGVAESWMQLSRTPFCAFGLQINAGENDRMKEQAANAKMITRLMFRLLPIQILLAGVGAVNGIVSGYFASNYVGIDAMSAVGLYAPPNMLVTAISTILVGGSVILCGKYMGQNQQEKMQNVFSLNLASSALIATLFIVLFTLLSIFDLTGFLSHDAAVRPIFNRYLLGQAVGILPVRHLLCRNFGISPFSFNRLKKKKNP